MPLAIALAQTNFTVGHLSGNLARIAALHGIAQAAGASLIVFSEMAITGYPPEDLILRKGFQAAAMQAVNEVAALTESGPAILIGGLWADQGKVYNTVFLMDGGRVIHRQYKRHLPNYGVFDEKRVFAQGPVPEPALWRGIRLGLLICEDMWEPDIASHLKACGAQLLISVNASPYELSKVGARIAMAKARIGETHLPLIYVNQIGGQDELVFDGRSFVSDVGGLRMRLNTFAEDFALVVLDEEAGRLKPRPGEIKPSYGEEEMIYRAMVVGLHDFVHKNGFKGVVLGLSGGIDSALSAAIAADALGLEHVRALMLPSPYTSQESLEDAEQCARLLGIRLGTMTIEPAMQAFEEMLKKVMPEVLKSVTMENIQPRLRGAVLMAVSNNEGLMLLTTGNKSEMSVGYATLYGDMCGGYCAIKDLYKTTVYKVARWRNAQSHVIPERIFTKAPTAELKLGQTDQDSLPPYDLLDAILFCLIEEQLSAAQIIARGYDAETVTRVAGMLYQAEYKRRQAPPGVKITGMSFGRDRRYPIVSGWRA
jgi:NAD+ synthase